MIDIRNVSKTFHMKSGIVEAVKDISIHIDQGDIYGMVGFSGAGKSTLIRLINALEKPTTGQVLINQKDVNELSKKELRQVRRSIGMIFQQFNLLDSKTIAQNIAMPLILNHVPKEEVEKRVDELLKFVELEDKKYAYPHQLSGGQKQRVGIARAIAMNPSILLCDEATSALDPKTTEAILALLKKINKELNITIVLITHEMNVIRSICNKVAVLQDGRLVEEGDVANIFGSPKQMITKNFVATVIHDEIPNCLKESIKKDARTNEVLRLKFFGENSKDSIISDINKELDIETNILFAFVCELQNTALGILILQFVGEHDELKKAKEYLRKNHVEYEGVVL